MKKKLLFTMFAFATLSVSAVDVPSEYCDKPIGHLGDPNFGAAESHIALSISKTSATSITVKAVSRTTTKLDVLEVHIPGVRFVVTGTDADAGSDMLEATLNFAEAPTDPNITLEIKWSNPAWDGRWISNAITVPFNAVCGLVIKDIVKPVMGATSVLSNTHNSATLALAATDVDDAGNPTPSLVLLLNDATNGIVDKIVNVTAEGKYVLSGLTPSTTYNIEVIAKDFMGNTSAPVTLTFTTGSTPESALIDDFEGASKMWKPVENAGVNVIANPHKDAINGSDNVLHISRAASQNQFWVSAILDPKVDGILPAGLAGSKDFKYLHVFMYRTNAHKPILKVSDAAPVLEARPMDNITMVANEWQDVVFDITTTAQLDFVMLMIDETFAALDADLDVYADNIICDNDATPRTKIGSGINNVTSEKYIVTVKNSTVNIQNLENETVSVYGINGQLITSKKAVSNQINIPLTSGLYLVKVGTYTTKVIVK